MARSGQSSRDDGSAKPPGSREGASLSRVAIFGALSPASLELLESRMESVEKPAGEAFFSEGELGDSLYLIESGRVAVERSRGGAPVVLAELGPGECFGEMALVAIMPRSATIRALERTRARRLRSRDLHELLRRDAEQFTILQMNLGREIARRLRTADDLLFERLAADSQSRASTEAKVGARRAGAVK